ncbi:tetratricopeptide repeat protein [Streptomyces sp. 7R007]
MTVCDPARTYAELHKTFREFVQNDDISLLLAPETTRRLVELTEWLGEAEEERGGPLSLRVARLMAWVHLNRWHDDPRREGASGELDRALAASFLLPYGQGAPAPLDGLVRRIHEALVADPPDPVLFQDAAGDLVTMADRYGCTAALGHGLRYMTRALGLMPEDDPLWAVVALNLCAAVLVEWRLAGESEHLVPAADRGLRAVDRLPTTDADLAAQLQQLGRLLMIRHAKGSGIEDVDRAIELYTRAAGIDTAPEELVRQILAELGLAWKQRHDMSGRRGDLDRAIETLRRVVPDREPLGHAFRTAADTLASCWEKRAGLTDDSDDLRHARRLRSLLAAEGGTAQDLIALAGVEERLFRRSGRAELLDASIGHYTRAEAADPGNATALIGLAWALKQRFEYFGGAADRDDAVTAARRSVDLTPPGHRSLGRRLAILASALTMRAQTTGSTPDLVEGLEVIDRALALPDESDEDRALQLLNKSALIAVRHELTEAAEDDDLQIELCREAVELLPDGHPKKGMYRTNLISAHLQRYRRTGHEDDLEAMLRVGELALAETPADHPSRLGILSNTAMALLVSVEDGLDAARLRRTVELLTEALTFTAQGQPLDARLRVNLGTALHHSGRPEDVERALRDWSTAAWNEAAAPDVRLTAATEWARESAELGRWDDAVAAYGLAVDLLTSVAGLHLERADQEARLTSRAPVTSEAVAAALEADDPDRALELLEAGRCVQWNHQLRSAGELALLADSRPELAAEIERTSAALGVVWSEAVTPGLPGAPATRG